MSAPARLKASTYVRHIPPGVYKIRHYWGVLKRHLQYFSSFDRRSFWRGISAGLLKAPLNVGSIFVTGLLVDSIVGLYPGEVGVLVSGVLIPIPVL